MLMRALLVIFLIVPGPLSAQGLPSRFQVAETKVFDLPDGVAPDQVRFSTTREAAVYPVKDGRSWRVVSDGAAGPAWDEVTDLRFTGPADLPAYSARKGTQWYAVVGADKSPAYDRILWQDTDGAPGPHPAVFIGARAGKDHYVVDLVEGPGFDQLGRIFTTLGKSVLYSGTDTGTDRKSPKGTVVWGDKSFAFPAPVVGLSWNGQDGQDHAAWAVQETDKGYVVADGQQGPDFDVLGPLDSWMGRFIYTAKSGSSWYYLAGDQSTPGTMGTNLDTLQLSKDGRVVAYEAGEPGHQRVLWNGAAGDEFDEVSATFLSPDEKTLLAVARKKGAEYLVVNGRAGEPYDKTGVYLGLYELRNDRWACAVQKGRQWFLVSDRGRDPSAWDQVSQLYFTPTGQLRAVVRKDGQDFLWEDGDTEFAVDELSYLPVGGKSVYGFGGAVTVAKVRVGSQTHLVVGTQQTPSYDSIPAWSPEDQGQVSYWGFRGRTLYRAIISPVKTF